MQIFYKLKALSFFLLFHPSRLWSSSENLITTKTGHHLMDCNFKYSTFKKGRHKIFFVSSKTQFFHRVISIYRKNLLLTTSCLGQIANDIFILRSRGPGKKLICIFPLHSLARDTHEVFHCSSISLSRSNT